MPNQASPVALTISFRWPRLGSGEKWHPHLAVTSIEGELCVRLFCESVPSSWRPKRCLPNTQEPPHCDRTRAVGGHRRLSASLLLVVILAGCGTPAAVLDLQRTAGDLPPRIELTDVPFFPQEENYCGPAALAMVLAWSGLPTTQDEIGKQVFTPGRLGTLQTDILAAARRNGRLAVPISDLRSLMAELAAGNPVLVFQNLGLSALPQWHYAVAIGYEREPGTLILHSGLENRRVVDLAVFERTWARAGHWALAVTAPDRLPVTASEALALGAALGLERAMRPAEAALAYEAMVGRWPDSFAAWMGLGNTRYALKDSGAAESAYRKAIAVRPASPQAWNNLAYALMALGRRPEAIAAAERAVALAGTDARPYRETLQELSAARPS